MHPVFEPAPERRGSPSYPKTKPRAERFWRAPPAVRPERRLRRAAHAKWRPDWQQIYAAVTALVVVLYILAIVLLSTVLLL